VNTWIYYIYLFENTFDRKRISANPSPSLNPNPNSSPNFNCNPAYLNLKHNNVFGLTKCRHFRESLRMRYPCNLLRWRWCYPTPSEGWERGGTPRRPSSRATPQGLNQRSKMEEVVPMMARRRGSDAGQSRRGELYPAEGAA